MQETFSFAYQSYKEMLRLLQVNGYHIANYHNWTEYPKTVILRHDIDNSPEKALRLAKLENEEGVCSTYFVMLTSDFYNVFSGQTAKTLYELASFGHEIGLHFDEKRYPDCFGKPRKCIEKIRMEAYTLQQLLGTPVSVVSMHRPSKAMLDANLQVPDMINSYGTTFFRDFKYLSDSRHHWREPVAKIISSQQYARLHILTHAVGWGETSTDLKEWIRGFLQSRMLAQWNILDNNFSNLEDVLPYEEFCHWIKNG